MMAETRRTIQFWAFWRVADGRSDVVIPLRSVRRSGALLTILRGTLGFCARCSIRALEIMHAS